MRICFIGPANSAHIVKWCTWFNGRGHETHVISFTPGKIENTEVHLIDIGVDVGGSDAGKLKYLTTGSRIKQLVDGIRPDIVNVHYATSYGMAVALSGIKRYVLSVWGSDIYDFPKKSPFHKVLLKYSLWKAPYLFSTSRAMAQEAALYTKKSFEITPFGVDMELFNPDKRNRYPGDQCLIVGTVKGLSDKYGIADILRAVSIIKREGIIPIRLRIAGKGPQEQEYKKLAKELDIEDITCWLGFISQEKAAEEWANMDIAVIPSTLESESFGVSAVEAQACGTAVIISNIPGLMEATDPGSSSIVVHRNSPEEIAEGIRTLADNTLRQQYAVRGLEYVHKHYEINHCFRKIEAAFEQIRDSEGSRA
ncbi:MAG: glycosyltransferase [Clostridia bacterium]|nr:glycosyltransferase [Clostridia bacterium]